MRTNFIQYNSSITIICTGWAKNPKRFTGAFIFWPTLYISVLRTLYRLKNATEIYRVVCQLSNAILFMVFITKRFYCGWDMMFFCFFLIFITTYNTRVCYSTKKSKIVNLRYITVQTFYKLSSANIQYLKKKKKYTRNNMCYWLKDILSYLSKSSPPVTNSSTRCILVEDSNISFSLI